MTDTLDNLSLVADDQTPAESLLEKELPEVTTESIVESILFSTDAPLSSGRIAQLLGIGDVSDVKKHIETLNARYERTGSSFRIQSIAKGYQMLTLPVYNNWVQKLHKTRHDAKLSSAAMSRPSPWAAGHRRVRPSSRNTQRLARLLMVTQRHS